MTVYAADTWGISGPRFIGIYLTVAALAVAVALLTRFLTGRGDAPSLTARDPLPGDVAYLAGGERRAIHSALAGLRAAEAVDTDDDKKVVATNHPPAGASDLERAVHAALGHGTRPAALYRNRGVEAALTAIRTRLVDAGLLYSDAQQQRMRWAAYTLFAAAALGVARLVSGMLNGKSVEFLFLATGAVLVLAVVLRKPPTTTPRANRILGQIRSSHQYLEPSQSPSWAVYGATGAGLSVALFGAGALWAADPAFAEEADITDGAMSTGVFGASGGGNFFGAGYDGGGFGGGDGGGGGGGCGGGGCGG
jgi:uncharacterized protein (TIGR04222 family)